jgi:hypothetical protein
MMVLAGLAGIAMLSSSQSWGDNTKKLERANLPTDIVQPRNAEQKPVGADAEKALAQSKFAEASLLTYQPVAGDPYFALQVKPSLSAGPRRPRDILLLVSTDASQAGPSWFAAHQITEGIIREAALGDRISLWMVSTPEDRFTASLTKGFLNVKENAKAFKAAVERLRDQYPAGDTDLKYALTRAVNSFEGQANRQRVVVYLGNGMSTHAPLTVADRADLGKQMVERQVTFFPMPLGRHLHPDNLHGLAMAPVVPWSACRCLKIRCPSP